ncbi:conserved hypothetical protein [Azospirillaceae bacterium]
MIPVILSTSTISAVATFITLVGGAYLTLRKISRDHQKSNKEHKAEILQLAKEADSLIKSELKNKIHDLEIQIDTLKESTNKDIAHLKETYNNEIKFLGQKIEALRNEVHVQHGQIVALLTKMIGNKD